MVVDFSVEEYFHQLKLMEEQYGQEEDLYPWIYMLLQMAEQKKKEKAKLEGTEYNPVSIRDVHNAQSGAKSIVNPRAKIIKENFLQKSSYPDFAVFSEWKEDKDNNEEKCEVLGCIEIKPFTNDKNFLSIHESEYSLNQLIPRFFLEFRNCNEWQGIEVCEELYRKIKKDINGYTIDVKNKIISFPSGEDVEKARFFSSSKVNPVNTKGRRNTTKTKKTLYPRALFLDGSIAYEMTSHIEHYKKVLYTNGIQFCMFILCEKNIVKINKIANLSYYYNCYKSGKDYNHANANKKWETLVDDLKRINWDSEPKPKAIEVKK